MRDILAELEAKGVSAQTINTIRQALQDAEALAKRRLADRKRQHHTGRGHVRSREVTLGHVTTTQPIAKPQPGHVTNGVRSLSSLESKKERKIATEKRSGRIIPPDWRPGQREIDEGHRLGFNDRDIAYQAEEMRTWGKANANRAIARKADWDLTFLGWLRRAAEKIAAKKPRWRSGIEGVI